MSKIKQFITWLLKTLRNISVYQGWPFLVAILVHWIFVNEFPTGFWLGFYVGAAIAISWAEIRRQLIKWWERE